MTLDEKIGQMTQAEQAQLATRATSRRISWARCSRGGGSRSPRRTACEAWTDIYDGCQSQRSEDAAGDPDPLRHRRRARPQQRVGAVIFPHNIGLGATRNPGAGRGDCAASRARGSAGDGHPLGVRALRRRAAGRALGPHVRGLPRGPSRCGRAGRRGGARAAGRRPARPAARARPAPSTSSATAARPGRHRHASTRSPAALPAGPGRHARRRGRAPQASTCAGYSPTIAAGVGIDHALLQQLERREVHGQQAAAHGHAQGRAGLRGLPDLRLQRDRPAARRLSRARSSSRSTPAWTW